MTIKAQFDGNFIAGKDPQELVSKMHALSWSQSKSDEEYMHALADRLVLQSSIEIRYDTAENFVEDLVKFGLLVVA